MLRNLATSSVVYSGLLLAGVFCLLLLFVDLAHLIVALNGVLAGCGVAVAVTFWELTLQAVTGRRPYSDVKQMALSIVLLWVAVGLSLYSSLQLRSMGLPITPLVATAAMRYVAIIAAVMQVTTPDYGLGPFSGKEKKTLWLAGTAGLVAAIVAIVIQVGEVFAA